MTPLARIRTIIKQAAEAHGVEPTLITTKCRKLVVVHARIEAAKRLDAMGFSSPVIGRALNHDHTTILFYLGRIKRSKPSPRIFAPPPPPKKMHWRRPHIRHLRWIGRPKRFLIPYAGADMTEYHWKERPRQ